LIQLNRVILGGGLLPFKNLPEADDVNFVPRVRVPVLMINGRYDFSYTFDGQTAMFRLLGTPNEHKRHAIFEAGHIPSRADIIRETLAWLDRYLGPVKRKEQ
jgi:eukaryotic-like serine/threonine-protein kinase